MHILIGILLAAVLYMGMVVLHEVGHLRTLNKYGRETQAYFKWPYIICGTPEDYKGLNKKQLRDIYITGIIFGFIPIAIALLALETLLPLLLVPVYLLGCREDIKEIIKLK